MGIIIRQGYKATFSNYIGISLGFLSLFILFPLFFEPEEVGIIRLFLELSIVLSAFSLMGTHYSINRFFPYFKTNDQLHHGFFFWVVLFPFIGFIMLIVLLLIFDNSFFLLININTLQYRKLFPALLTLVFIILYQIVVEVSCANHGRIAVPNFIREVVMRILIIISGFLYYIKITTFYQTIWLIVISYAIALISSIVFLAKLTKINLRPDFDFINSNKHISYDALKFTLFLFFSGIASLITPKLDFFMIAGIRRSLSDVAIYSIGFYLASFIEVPKRTILQVATPIIANHMRHENFKEVEILNKKNATNQFLISIILFILIWLNIDNMYYLMPKGEFYSRGKWVVFFIGISKIIDAIICTGSPIVSNSKFYALALINNIIATVFGIGLNYYFITRFGFIGGAISTIAVMLIISISTVMIIQIKLRINPFSREQLKLLTLFIVFLLITFLGNWFQNPYLDAIIRTSVVGSLLIFSIYMLKISEDFNKLLLSNLRVLHIIKQYKD